MDTTQTLTDTRTNAAQVGAILTTGLFAVLIAISGVLYLVGPPPIVAAIRNLGYPDYFRPLLGIAKLLGCTHRAALADAPGVGIRGVHL
jgi:DoxX-like family